MVEQSFWEMLRTKRDSLTKSGIIVADYLLHDNIRKPLRLPVGHIRLFYKGGVICFIRVFYIDNHLAEPAFYPPDRSGSHGQFSIGWGKTTASVIFLTAVSN